MLEVRSSPALLGLTETTSKAGASCGCAEDGRAADTTTVKPTIVIATTLCTSGRPISFNGRGATLPAHTPANWRAKRHSDEQPAQYRETLTRKSRLELAASAT